MDPRTLLTEVAKAYEDLASFSADIVCVNESGDEDSSSRSEQRSKAWYAKPDKIRLEQGGARGSVFVSDGAFFQSYFAHTRHYSKSPFVRRDFLPGSFRAEHPLVGGGPEFLFHQINDRVAAADIQPDPRIGVHAILVTYEPTATNLLWWSSPVKYWIDARSHLVLRAEAEGSHRTPASDEWTKRNKKTVSFTRMDVNTAIAPELFEYSRPPEAEDKSLPPGEGGRISFAGGSGGTRRLPDKSGYMEERGRSEWLGKTYIQRHNLRLRGMDLEFERRLTFSEDGSELHIAERISGPKGQIQGDFTIPLGEKGTAKIE